MSYIRHIFYSALWILKKHRDMVNYIVSVIDKKNIVIQNITFVLKKSSLNNYEIRKEINVI